MNALSCSPSAGFYRVFATSNGPHGAPGVSSRQAADIPSSPPAEPDDPVDPGGPHKPTDPDKPTDPEDPVFPPDDPPPKIDVPPPDVLPAPVREPPVM